MAPVGHGSGRGELMPAEEMGKLSNRIRAIFAVSSVLFLAVLAISPFKDYRREWKQYKRSYLRFAQARPDTKKLIADYRHNIDQIDFNHLDMGPLSRHEQAIGCEACRNLN